MKVAHAEKHVLGTGGLKEAQAFKIRTSAHAFKILSSGLYSDKITAVLREIGCNAHDAHIAMGIAHRPFDVKLPNQLDNQFYIRDHGTGLSHEDVLNLYTTYFASTKQESNDFTGAFGLGSKSPFSYTDSFTITACHGGKKRIYTAHIGDEGSPIVALMSESDVDADWQTGIEVGFPVRPEDFRSFAEKAAKVFRFFSPLPKVVGSNVLLKPLKIEQDFGTYAFLDKEDEGFNDGICVQMGNVKYPVDTNQLTLNRGAAVEKGKELKGLLLRFDLGKLQVAASREELQYDPVTQKAIASRLGEVLISLAKEIKQAFDNATTWAKLCQFKKLRQDVSRGIYLNEDLFKLAGITDKRLCEACSSHYFNLPPKPAGILAHYCLLHIETSQHGARMRVTRPTGVASRGYIDYEDNIVIVSGVAPQGQGRIRQALLNGTLTGKVLLIVPKRKEGGTQTDVDAVLKIVTTAFRGISTKELEDFPAPIIVRAKRKKGAGLPPLPPEEVIHHGSPMKITEVAAPVYVLYKRTSAWGRKRRHWLVDDGMTASNAPDHKSVYEDVDTINKAIPDAGIHLPAEVTRMNARRYGLSKRPEWVPFKDHVKARLSDPDNIKALKALLGGSKYVVDLGRWYSDHNTSFLDNMVQLKEKHTVLFKTLEPVLRKHGVLGDIERVHKDSKNPPASASQEEPAVLTAYRDLAEALGVQIDTPAFHKATQNIDDKYKLAAGVQYDMWTKLGTHAPKVLPQFLDEVLTRR